MEVNPVLKKRYGKKNLLGLFSSSSGKIDLILLIKVITFYMRLFMVYIQGTGFQGLISRLFGVCGSLSPKIVLKIRYKFCLVYLRTRSAAVGTITIKRFTTRDLAGWSNNLSPNLGTRKELESNRKVFLVETAMVLN